MQSHLIVIQPTGFCNIDCSYCYLADRSHRSYISNDTLRWICRRILETDRIRGDLDFLWHAGEPLTVGLRRFREYVNIINSAFASFPYKLSHIIQTNGVLLNHEWLAFFRDMNISVGVSIDGPALLHDQHRKYRNGRGTHAEVMRGLKLCREEGVAFYALSVITDSTLSMPDYFYDFFADLKPLTVGLLPEESVGNGNYSSLIECTLSGRYTQFVKRLIERNLSGPHFVRFREIEKIVTALSNPAFRVFDNAVNTPWSIISFDVQGNFSTFSPELLTFSSERFPSFRWGNVYSNSIDQVEEMSEFQHVKREIDIGIARCQETCAYWAYCGSDSPARKVFEKGRFDIAETHACNIATKELCDAVVDAIADGMSNP